MIRTNGGSAFLDKQIALLKTFADQAVIAIENVRLFQELEAERTRELHGRLGSSKRWAKSAKRSARLLDLETVLATIVSRGPALGPVGSSTNTTKAAKSFISGLATSWRSRVCRSGALRPRIRLG